MTSLVCVRVMCVECVCVCARVFVCVSVECNLCNRPPRYSDHVKYRNSHFFRFLDNNFRVKIFSCDLCE